MGRPTLDRHEIAEGLHPASRLAPHVLGESPGGGGTRLRRQGLAAAWWPVGFAMLVIAWGGNEFTPLLSVYRSRSGFSQVDVDVFLGAYVVGLVPGLLISSAASDRFGRRPALLGGLACAMIGSTLLALGDPLGYEAVFAGRALSGLAVGVAMSVGTAWVTELSSAPLDPDPHAGAGARRSSVLLTLGFAAGPASAGLLAQWASQPLMWPYLVHLTLCVPAGAALALCALETRGRHIATTRPVRVRLPAASRRRFLHVVCPMAPWIFGSAGIAYAIVPQVVSGALGSWLLLFTAGSTVVTLVSGVAVQPLARRLDDHSTARAVVTSMMLMTIGVALAALTAATGNPWLAAPVTVVLGAAYGVAVVSGLLEVQRMATPNDLGGLTGVYYSLAYVGFTLPALLAYLSRWFDYAAMLIGLAGLAVCSTLVCLSGWSRHLPGTQAPQGGGQK